MARKNNIKESNDNIIDEFTEIIDDSINKDNEQENIIKYETKVKEIIEQKEEYCKVLWIKKNAFSIDFQGYGISFHISDNHLLDTEKIKDYITVKYESEIGLPDFKAIPKYN